ncbi:glutathione S-transferase 1-1 [Musca domestica]|uniref:Glutathione S-transferase 1-1 n=1 Tax=Musca domestica TaxID=7370 RepID=A0ABM3USV3_MUSDO|nr:glutathione S-transferase 1-1 [Musca domestica]
MSKPILYMNPLSAPSRAVMYLVKYLGLELECIEISFDTRETLTPEFRKLNPQHTVPTLVDGHDVIYDSHAICGYLVDKYATNDELYPKGLVQRTLVQILYGGLESVPKDVVRCLHESWMILEDILKDSPYLCGENMTIADICCLATITAVLRMLPLLRRRIPNCSTGCGECVQCRFITMMGPNGCK